MYIPFYYNVLKQISGSGVLQTFCCAVMKALFNKCKNELILYMSTHECSGNYRAGILEERGYKVELLLGPEGLYYNYSPNLFFSMGP